MQTSLRNYNTGDCPVFKYNLYNCLLCLCTKHGKQETKPHATFVSLNIASETNPFHIQMDGILPSSYIWQIN